MAVGIRSQADGPGTLGAAGVREGKTGEQIVGQAHGKYYEAAHRGQLFNACDQGTGVAPGTALGTTALMSLYNPAGSGKRLAIKKVGIGYISGTLGAGTVFHCVLGTTTQAAPSGGTLLVNQNCDVGSGNTSVGQARTGSTVVQPVALRPFVSLDAELASSVVGLRDLTEDVDGEIVLEPGTSYQMQSVAAAGTSPKVSPSVTWEEIPIV